MCDSLFLPVDTRVSAKFCGAYCKAIIKSVERRGLISVQTNSKETVKIDCVDYISGKMIPSYLIKVRLNSSEVLVTFLKFHDHSVYTVVFDDGEGKLMRRSQIRKIAIDTHTNTVYPPFESTRMNRKKMKILKSHNLSRTKCAHKPQQVESMDVGDVILLPDSEKSDKEFVVPAIVCDPSADHMGSSSESGKILIKSFYDGNFKLVDKSRLSSFVRNKVRISPESKMYRAIEQACIYYDLKRLPENWSDQELLGKSKTEEEKNSLSGSESSEGPSDIENKDLFVAHFFKFLEDCRTPINTTPTLGNHEIDYYEFFKVVKNLGGYKKVSKDVKWHLVREKMKNYECDTQEIRQAYIKYLSQFEDFNKKFGFVVLNRSTGIISGASWREQNIPSNRIVVPFSKKKTMASSPKINIKESNGRQISRLDLSSLVKDENYCKTRDEFFLPGNIFEIMTDDTSVTYRIKIIDVDDRDDCKYYQVHYVGWNVKFDDVFDEATLWMLLNEVRGNWNKMGIRSSENTDSYAERRTFYKNEVVDTEEMNHSPIFKLDCAPNTEIQKEIENKDVKCSSKMVERQSGEWRRQFTVPPTINSYVSTLVDNFVVIKDETEMMDFIEEYNKSVLNLDGVEDLTDEGQCVFWENKLEQMHRLYKKTKRLKNALIRRGEKNKKIKDV